MYLNLIGVAKRRYGFHLYEYCLMTNHVHLHIQTISTEIWTIMHCINTGYSKYFNSKYDVVGHLFQGRYKAELIKDDSHNLHTSRYIHLNPVKANLVNDPAEYAWSSYRTYLGMEDNWLIDPSFILDYFSFHKAIDGNFDEELSQTMQKISQQRTNPRKSYQTFVEG